MRPEMRENLLAFLADLFYWFEVQTPAERAQLTNGQEAEGKEDLGAIENHVCKVLLIYTLA